MVPARLNMVTLGARDMANMRDFYRRLGWEEAESSNDEYARFKTGGAFLSLFPLSELLVDANAPESSVKQGFSGVTLAINVEERQMVDEAIDGARAAGATITKEAVDAFWGGRSGYFTDPEGNYWEVAWLPDSSFDERGGLIPG